MRSMLGMGLIIGSLGLAAAAPAAEVPEFTTEFDLDDCTFSDRGRNVYFSLEPGDRLVLAEDGEDGREVVQITVLGSTRSISFRTAEGEEIKVRARVVEERETLDNELVEVSRNFFARCVETGNIHYLGEEVDIYEDGEIVSHEGAWRAGVDGALPGVIMPGSFLLGSRYFQEIAPGVALDRAENVAMGLTLDLPAGRFEDCVRIIETSPLDPRGAGSEKLYCEEIGLVFDSGAELIDYQVAAAERDASRRLTARSVR